MAKANTNTASKSATKSKAEKSGAKPKAEASKKPRGKTAAQTESSSPSMTFASPSHDRDRMVQYAAYHIAEKDGFQSGKEQDYWLQAERQIDELFKGQPQGQSANSYSEVH